MLIYKLFFKFETVGFFRLRKIREQMRNHNVLFSCFASTLIFFSVFCIRIRIVLIDLFYFIREFHFQFGYFRVHGIEMSFQCGHRTNWRRQLLNEKITNEVSKSMRNIFCVSFFCDSFSVKYLTHYLPLYPPTRCLCLTVR